MDENNGYFDNLSGTEPQSSTPAQNLNPEPEPAWRPVPPEKPQKAEKGSGKGLFLGGLVTGIAGALLVLGICYLGIYVQNIVESGKLAAEQEVGVDENSAINSSTLSKMQMLERTIDQYFYLHDVTDEEIQDGIYRGMLSALGDPYSEYYSAEELNALILGRLVASSSPI